MAKASLRSGAGGSAPVEFFLRARNSNRRWLWFNGIPSNIAGYRILADTVLTSVTVFTTNIMTTNFSIRNAAGELVLVSLVADDFKTVTGLSIACNAQDEIKVYMEGADGASFPKVVLGF